MKGKQSTKDTASILFFPRFSFSEKTNFLNLRMIFHLHLIDYSAFVLHYLGAL